MSDDKTLTSGYIIARIVDPKTQPKNAPPEVYLGVDGFWGQLKNAKIFLDENSLSVELEARANCVNTFTDPSKLIPYYIQTTITTDLHRVANERAIEINHKSGFAKLSTEEKIALGIPEEI